MSIDDVSSCAGTPRSPRSSRGFTFIEMIVVVAVVGLMALVVQSTVSGLTATERSLRAMRNTVERGQRGLSAVRDSVSTSRKLFQKDTVGNGYLNKLALGSLPLLAGSRLPVFDESNPLGPDVAGTPMTGNVLLFVREADPLPCIADPTTKLVRLIDAYRLVCIYTTQTTRRVVAGGPLSLDLVEWRSVVFPSYSQVTSISDSTQRTRVVKDLFSRFGRDYLWDPTGSVTTSFYGIDGLGTVAASPTAVTTIAQDRNVSNAGRFVYANMDVARTDATSKPRTPLFTADDPAVWTPNGFEVKVVGPSGSRKVWLRLTIEQQASKDCVPAQETTAVVSTRDL